MIYIASPYSAPTAAEREANFQKVAAFAAEEAKEGHVVYCPIAAWHSVACMHNLPKEFDFWMKLNIGILRHCTELWVYCMPGWEKSKGVTAEIECAKSLHLTIRYFTPKV